MLKGFTRNFPALKILTEEQVEAIHRATLGVLEDTGIRFESEKALKFLDKNGCNVDYDERMVRFPPGLVEEAIRTCPSSFHVKARDPKDDLIIGGNTVYFMSSCGMQTVDLDTWEPRPPTRREAYDAIKVMDALPNLHLFQCYPYFGFDGLPEVMKIPEIVATKIRNSTKFQNSCYSEDCEIFNIEMAKAVGTDIMISVHPAPPLTFYHDAVEVVFRAVEAGFPIRAVSVPVSGGTAPATIAGAVVINNTEILATVVLAQLIKPGTKVYAVTLIFPQNMRTGSPGFGAIESGLGHVMFEQLYRKYQIPSGEGVPFGKAKKMDIQSGYERATGAWLCALSGGNSVQIHGSVHGELTFHPVQAVVDDDIAGMIGHFIEGVKVSDETLAIDLIKEVGPIPGFYLDKEHTRKWWKLEQFLPQVADILTYPEWMKTGKKGCIDYAKERMQEILATHKPVPLTPRQEEDIERILNEARKYYRDKGRISDTEWAVYMRSLQSAKYPYG